MASKTFNIPWAPQPRQADLLAACGLLDVIATGGAPKPPVASLIGYGGAAYGGKTDGALGVIMAAAMAFPNCRIGFFRRTFGELEGEGGIIDRSIQVMTDPEFATYNAGAHLWTFFNGSRCRFAHCQHEKDRTKYQSNQFDIIIFDEATHFTWRIVDYLLTRNRKTTENTIEPFALFMTNPGNIGHVMYKSIFIDGPWEKVKRAMLPSGGYEQVIFLSAKIADNEIGVARDPGYADRLRRSDPALAEALLEGNWDVFEGQAFREFARLKGGKPWHVIDPIQLPKHFPKWRAVDWGYDHPFYALWSARNPDNGRVFWYREIMERLLTDTQQARIINDMSPPDEGVQITYADPSMWAKKTYQEIITSTADEYETEGVMLTRADNDRISGKRKLHRFLAPLPDGLPGLQIFSTCTEMISTLPTMVLDEVNVEDVKKMEGDDPYDTGRYSLTKVEVYHKPPGGKKKPKDSPIKRVKRGL